MEYTSEQIKQAYDIVKGLNGPKKAFRTQKEAIEHLVNKNIAKEWEAKLYIYVFRNMRRGTEYTRELRPEETRVFLDNIYEDFQNEGLAKALSAIEQHISYRTPKKKLPEICAIFEEYSKILSYDPHPGYRLTQDEIEQENIIRELDREKISKDNLINKIQRLTNTSTPTSITTTTSSYKRENQIIALIKLLRGQKCQICETSILKKDGRHYVEAAHIKPKHQGGEETLENIILLCPNHHKEFDLGNSHATLHKDSVTLVLNGTPHTLLFVPKT